LPSLVVVSMVRGCERLPFTWLSRAKKKPRPAEKQPDGAEEKEKENKFGIRLLFVACPSLGTLEAVYFCLSLGLQGKFVNPRILIS